MLLLESKKSMLRSERSLQSWRALMEGEGKRGLERM